MTQPKVTIITPTYNKPTYFKECAESIINQTFQDWVWWVVFNDCEWPLEYHGQVSWKFPDFWNDPRILPLWYPTVDYERQEKYIPAQIINWLYLKVQTPYILFLADDDLLDPEGLNRLVNSLELRKNDWDAWEAVYGRCEVQVEQPDGSYLTTCWAYDGQDVGLGTGIEPDCRLDGGQVLHTKALWDMATADGWQLTDSLDEAAHCDGILLNRLAEFATIHYIPQRIITHRRTKLSTHLKP